MGFKPDVVSQLDDFIMRWDIAFPTDLWWRKHYNIPFGSAKHLEIDMIDQLFAYREHQLINKAQSGELDEETRVIKQNNENGADKQVIEMSQEEIERAFDDLDLSKYQ